MPWKAPWKKAKDAVQGWSGGGWRPISGGLAKPQEASAKHPGELLITCPKGAAISGTEFKEQSLLARLILLDLFQSLRPSPH